MHHIIYFTLYISHTKMGIVDTYPMLGIVIFMIVALIFLLATLTFIGKMDPLILDNSTVSGFIMIFAGVLIAWGFAPRDTDDE